MPFLNGKTPNFSETLTGVKDLYSMGFLMGDAKPENFLKLENGDVVPIDFGLVFILDKLETIDNDLKKKIISDYIKGGFRYVPEELKTEYISCFKKLSDLLGKDSPTRNMNIKKLLRTGLL